MILTLLQTKMRHVMISALILEKQVVLLTILHNAVIVAFVFNTNMVLHFAFACIICTNRLKVSFFTE